MRAGLVGCGRIAGLYDPFNLNTHAGAIAASADIELCFCLDKKLDRANKLANYHSVLASSDLESMMAQTNPNLVVICNSTDEHFETCRYLLNKKFRDLRAIVVEKPLCLCRDEWLELRKLSKKTTVKVLVNHTRRLNRLFQNIKKEIQSGKFGKLVRFESKYYGGWLLNGVHAVDVFCYLFEEGVEWRFKFDSTSGRSVADRGFDVVGLGVESDASVRMNYFEEKNYQVFDFDIFFEKSRLQINNFGTQIHFEKAIANDRSEMVLESIKDDNLYVSDHSEFSKLYGGMDSYLFDPNTSDLRYLEIDNITLTMEALWAGLDVTEFTE